MKIILMNTMCKSHKLLVKFQSCQWCLLIEAKYSFLGIECNCSLGFFKWLLLQNNISWAYCNLFKPSGNLPLVVVPAVIIDWQVAQLWLGQENGGDKTLWRIMWVLWILLCRPRWKCRHQQVWGKNIFLGQIIPGDFSGKAAYHFHNPF